MKVNDGRSIRMQKIKEDNRKLIADWAESQPEEFSVSDCMKGTGKSYRVVREGLDEWLASKGVSD